MKTKGKKVTEIIIGDVIIGDYNRQDFLGKVYKIQEYPKLIKFYVKFIKGDYVGQLWDYRFNKTNGVLCVLDAENEINDISNMKIQECDISIRLQNALFAYGLDRFNSTVKDLSNISRYEIFKQRNVGRKCMLELDRLCNQANIKMLD